MSPEGEHETPTGSQQSDLSIAVARMGHLAEAVPLRAYIVEGIRHGFRVGYNFNSTCHHVRGNMKSAGDNPQVIQDYLTLNSRNVE